MQVQQISCQRHYVAHPAAGPQIVQIPRYKTHLDTVTELLNRGSGFLHTHLRMFPQQLGGLQHHRRLAHGHVFGVDVGHVVPAFRCQNGVLIGAGGRGGIRQMEDVLIRPLAMNVIQYLCEIIRHTGAGLRNLSRCVIIGTHILRREGSVI